MRNERIYHVREVDRGSGFGWLIVIIAAAILGVWAAFNVDLSALNLPSVLHQPGKEVCDEYGWRWWDNDLGMYVYDKEVYIESEDKWVRYDGDGYMVKGWYTNENGTYYYDLVTGAMLKGAYVIDGLPYYFDDVTGVLK